MERPRGLEPYVVQDAQVNLNMLEEQTVAQAQSTTDHATVRKWAESRNGRPARVKGTESRDGAGILRIDFNEPEESLEQISWDEFFDTFDDRELTFLYQDKTADGKTSRFFKFVRHDET